MESRTLFLVSEALDEALDGPVSQQDLLSPADVIVKSDQEGFVGEYDRPLNGSNPNFYSLPATLRCLFVALRLQRKKL